MTAHITLLTSATHNYIIKTFGGPDLKVQPFTISKNLNVCKEAVYDFHSLSELLRRLESEPTQTMITGSLIEGKTNPILRNKDTFSAIDR